jgi:hypothetical protein
MSFLIWALSKGVALCLTWGLGGHELVDVAPVLDHAVAEGDVEVARHLSTQRIYMLASYVKKMGV